jgi:hypothetical protein
MGKQGERKILKGEISVRITYSTTGNQETEIRGRLLVVSGQYSGDSNNHLAIWQFNNLAIQHFNNLAIQQLLFTN